VTSSAPCIAAVGARTPLGLRAAPAAAALRAGISALREHPFMIDRLGDPMPAALDARLDPALMGTPRLLALAESALREACGPLDGAPGGVRRLPLYLALPELRPGFTDAEAVASGLGRLPDLPVRVAELKVSTDGHAAGLLALAAALDTIREGEADACLVGGVDSYFHPDTMDWLDQNRQLAGADGRSAFIPGEGAAFLLVASEAACLRMGVEPRVRVAAAAVGRETKLIKTEDICLGEGLTATVQAAAAALASPDTINDVICDINGERYRGEEWGFVCLRASQWFDDPTGYRAPADAWGDVGAASGPLFAMLAFQAAARGYARGPRTLLWASSEAGLRGAALLEVAGNGAGPHG
jgi:3-oxoacyl-[acyl-carrier-protein] synthase-1